MTAFRHLRRRPTPATRQRFRIEAAPFRADSAFGSAFAAAPFREALRSVALGGDPASRTTSKPRSR
jgi:hypothetical protein